MTHLLDNIAWHSLAGAHARFAAGRGDARRYAQGYSAIVGFPEPQRPDFTALAKLCTVDEPVYCPEWTGLAPAGWQIRDEMPAFRMTWQNGMANNEGWRARADYESAYASCTGTNVYHARVVHRPGS